MVQTAGTLPPITRAQMSKNRTVKRCAIYIRVSTAMQMMEGWSLEAQRAGLEEVAKAKGWKVVGVYADEGKTARKRLKDRRAIHQLLADVRAGLVDVILFKELDRWFRSLSDFYKVQDVLDEYGVKWYSQQQPTLEMDTKEGRLQVNVLLSVGQNETDTTSDRIKYTQAYLIQQKRWTSGPRTLPRGYTLDKDQHVIIDPEQEPYVRALFDNFRRCGSFGAALFETNAEYNTLFRYCNASMWLKNPMLYGEYQGIPDFIEKPYLTKKEWTHFQGLIKRNARQGTAQNYIFAGLLFCDECGRRMAGTATKRTKKTYKHYRCNFAVQTKQCHQHMRINEEKLEAALVEYIRESVAGLIVKVEDVQQRQKKKKPKKNNRASIERQLDKLEDVYISSDRMTKERYEAKKAAILAKLIEEDEPEEELPELADLKRIQRLFDDGFDALYATFTEEEKREFWRGVVSRVVIRDKQIIDVDFVK